MEFYYLKKAGFAVSNGLFYIAGFISTVNDEQLN